MEFISKIDFNSITIQVVKNTSFVEAQGLVLVASSKFQNSLWRLTVAWFGHSENSQIFFDNIYILEIELLM